jgi:PiT family inorganic phosphate transporter
MDVQLILLIIGLILAFLMAVNIGGNDACNPVSPAIGAGALTIRRALLFFAIFTVLGASLQGFMVMKTIGSGIVPQIDVVGAIAIVIAANIWVFLATNLGMNISTGHSLIAAVIGYGIVQYSIAGLNGEVIESIIISWLTSPLCSLVLSFIIYKLISSYVRKHQNNTQKLDRIFRFALIATLCFASYSFGANDVSHATGVYKNHSRCVWNSECNCNVSFGNIWSGRHGDRWAPYRKEGYRNDGIQGNKARPDHSTFSQFG